MPLKDPIARAAYAKKLYEDKREERKIYMKKYREKNLAVIHEKDKKRRSTPEEKLKAIVYGRKYRRKNRDKTKQYRRDHALDRLRQMKKSRALIGDILNMSGNMYKYANMNWAKFIKKSGKCAYCESTDTLNAHHVLSKSKFPGLALGANNGIPLCITCHREHHALNGVTA